MSKPFTVNELRQSYREFFVSKGCVDHPSAPLIPENDPTILFTVAGMAQFKDMFLGRGNLPFSRATTCQKCIRTNDILQVGRTPRHHTFFEMLGNFSFNDYFKRETITWAWEFLTEVIGLEAERLSVSVHQIDDEAYDIWARDIGLPASRIFRLGDADNFWPADAPTDGPLGPGGCCSEIFWDFQTNDDPTDDLTKDSGRFVEVWNCVFPQFNVCEPRVDGRYTLDDLGRTNIDTGMGLERLACVVQGKYNNFDIDLLQIIVQGVVQVTGCAYVAEAAAGTPAEEQNALIRRIADHVRAVTFCIADGALPGNTGRGYIVRRLIRRATLDADRLGCTAVRLHEVVAAVVDAMGEAYPEIQRRQELAVQTLHAEEEHFRRTLRKGLDLLARALARHQGQRLFSGDDTFELVTTHGFPKELIEELVTAEGLTIDETRFAERWSAFQAISNSKSGDVFTSTALQEAKPRLGATEFVGYERLVERCAITLLEAEGREVPGAVAGTAVRVALDRTPFYAESGGQVGDSGHLTGDGFAIRIDATRKDEGLIIHSGVVTDGHAVPGPVLATVDAERRAAITRHHSATHLLHAALYTVLGDHVEQQGSEVRPDQLRFDFNHPQAPSKAQLAAVETWVNERVRRAEPVLTEVLPIADARARGAKAQFGEKYGDEVRVVCMGTAAQPSSMELCGGCHVADTGAIGAVRIVREEATAAGIRRVIAVAGSAAEALAVEEQHLIDACAAELGLPSGDPADLAGLVSLFKANGPELIERVRGVVQQLTEAAQALGDAPPAGRETGVLARVEEAQAQIRQLQRRYQEDQARTAVAAVQDLLATPQEMAGVPVYSARLDGVDAKALREAAEVIAQQATSHCVVLAAETAGKALLLVAVSDDLVARGLKAGALVGKLAKVVDGGGGGKPQLAQAGGKNPAALPKALAALPELIAQDIA